MKFLRNKKFINQQKEGKFKDIFIAEDLTPLRARILWYINQNYSHKFCNIHTMNGMIRMKKNENDAKWLNINNPDDLFKHLTKEEEESFDLKAFNKGLHRFKILPQNPIPVPLPLDISSDEEEVDEYE